MMGAEAVGIEVWVENRKAKSNRSGAFRPWKKQHERAALKKKIATSRRLRAREPRHTKIWVITFTLGMASVCGLYASQQYYRNDRLFLLIFSAVIAAAASGCLAYCWKKRMMYNGIFWQNAEWIYRDDEPFLYWAYMALYSLFCAAVIYVFFHFLIKGSM